MTAREKATRVLIAEDHAVLREGLRELLEKRGGFAIAGEARDGLEAVALARKLKPDVVVMDLSMPKQGGVDALREIAKRLPGTKIVALTCHKSEEYCAAALAAGASGYVLKDYSYQELFDAIRTALAGGTFLSPEVAKIVSGDCIATAQAGRRTAWDAVSPREREVLKLVAEGRRSREIAEELGICVQTVEKHRANVMHKLDLHSVSALTAFAAQKNLVG